MLVTRTAAASRGSTGTHAASLDLACQTTIELVCTRPFKEHRGLRNKLSLTKRQGFATDEQCRQEAQWEEE